MAINLKTHERLTIYPPKGTKKRIKKIHKNISKFVYTVVDKRLKRDEKLLTG